MLTALGWMTIGAFVCIFAACCLCAWGEKVSITGR